MTDLLKMKFRARNRPILRVGAIITAPSWDNTGKARTRPRETTSEAAVGRVITTRPERDAWQLMEELYLAPRTTNSYSSLRQRLRSTRAAMQHSSRKRPRDGADASNTLASLQLKLDGVRHPKHLLRERPHGDGSKSSLGLDMKRGVGRLAL